MPFLDFMTSHDPIIRMTLIWVVIRDWELLCKYSSVAIFLTTFKPPFRLQNSQYCWD